MNEAPTRNQRDIRNSAFNFGSQALAILAGLICIPITFRQLGTERFGLLTLVWSTLSYAIAFDLGTGPAVSRATASSLAKDGGVRIAAIVKAGMAIQTVLGTITALVIAAFAPTLIALIKVPHEFRHDATLALYALALTLPFVLLTQSQQAVLEGLERFDLIAYVRTPIAIATYAVPAIGALSGWSLARMMFFLLISRVLGMLVMHVLYRGHVPAGQSGAVRTELPGLFKFGKWLAVSGVLAQVLMYLDRFLLSAMRGLSAVAQYAAPYDAAVKLLVLPGSVSVAMFPGLVKDAAQSDYEEAITRSRVAGRTILRVLFPISAVLVVFAGPLLHLWLGPKLGPEGVMAFRILTFATLLHAVAFPPVVLIEAFGRSDVIAKYSVAELLAYTPILVVAIWRYGVVGAAAAWALRTAALMMWSLWYVRRHMRQAHAVPATRSAKAGD